jgi:type I restriction enzyme, S subunit
MKYVRLGDIAELIRGVSFDGGEAAATPRPAHLPILRAGNLAARLILDADLVWIPEGRVAPNQKMRLGDIALCMSSGSPLVVGKTAILDRVFEGSVGAFCALIRPRSNVDARYLSYWMRSPVFWAWRDAQARGGSIQNLRLSQLATLEVPVPSLADQRHIASELSDHLAAVEQAREHAAAAQAVIAEFRDQVLDTAFARSRGTHAPLGRLGWLADGDWILTADYAPEGVRLLQVGDVGRGDLKIKSNRFISPRRAQELDCTLLRPGDILISRMPDPIGRACLLPDLGYEAITAVDVTIFRPRAEALHPEFAVLYMNSRTWLKAVADRASGATRARISRKNLEQQLIPLPRLSDQRRIAALLTRRLATIDSLARAADAELKAIGALPAALLRRAFGKREAA